MKSIVTLLWNSIGMSMTDCYLNRREVPAEHLSGALN